MSVVCTADLPPAVSTAGSIFSIVMIIEMVSTCFRAMVKNRGWSGGGSFQPRAADRRFHDGPAPECLHNWRLFSLVYLALAARAESPCLPGQTHKLSTKIYIDVFLLSIAWPPVVSTLGNSFRFVIYIDMFSSCMCTPRPLLSPQPASLCFLLVLSCCRYRLWAVAHQERKTR